VEQKESHWSSSKVEQIYVGDSFIFGCIECFLNSQEPSHSKLISHGRLQIGDCIFEVEMLKNHLLFKNLFCILQATQVTHPPPPFTDEIPQAERKG
jgi:hypothetical protein